MSILTNLLLIDHYWGKLCLQPSVGPWPLFQFPDLLHSR
jgi:hypothetical protein